MKQWANKYHRTTDFIVVEGPAAGGHLGFIWTSRGIWLCCEHDKSTIVEAHRMEQMSVDKEIEDIVALKKEYENNLIVISHYHGGWSV